MAWKEKTAEEIIGMSPDELKAKLAKIEAFESQFGDLKTLIETQATSINQLGESIKALPVKSPYDSNNDGSNNDGGDGKKKRPEWGVDDTDLVFADRTAPLVNLTLDTRGAVARRSVQDEMQDKFHDWHLFADEIDEMAKKEPLQSRAQEGFWRNVYYVVKGKHANEIAQDQINKSGKFYTESANSITMRKDEQKTPVEMLTDDQKLYAKKMGVSLEDYAKFAQEQRVQ